MMMLLGVLLLQGCLQLETRIKVSEDGTATVTERMRFSRLLLDQAGAKQAELLAMLGREAVLERMKKMGPGVTLVSTDVHEAEGDSREVISVFKLESLNGFTYVSPWLAYADYATNNSVTFKMAPRYKHGCYEFGAGTMVVSLSFPKPPVDHPKPSGATQPPPELNPLEKQILRNLTPVVSDLLNDFWINLTLESYAPLSSELGVRNSTGNAKSMELLDLSDTNLDLVGERFLNNEEIMIEMLSGKFYEHHLMKNTTGAIANSTLPILCHFGSPSMGWSPGNTIRFAPSRKLFDKYFAGKKLDYSAWAPSPPDKLVDADFDKIGWKGSTP